MRRIESGANSGPKSVRPFNVFDEDSGDDEDALRDEEQPSDSAQSQKDVQTARFLHPQRSSTQFDRTSKQALAPPPEQHAAHDPVRFQRGYSVQQICAPRAQDLNRSQLVQSWNEAPVPTRAPTPLNIEEIDYNINNLAVMFQRSFLQSKVLRKLKEAVRRQKRLRRRAAVFHEKVLTMKAFFQWKVKFFEGRMQHAMLGKIKEKKQELLNLEHFRKFPFDY